jgi:hypothetical protein
MPFDRFERTVDGKPFDVSAVGSSYRPLLFVLDGEKPALPADPANRK